MSEPGRSNQDNDNEEEAAKQKRLQHLMAMLEAGMVTMEDIAGVVNSYGRELALTPLVYPHLCEYCGKGFYQQSQDSAMVRAGHRGCVCFRPGCRTRLKQKYNRKKPG